jgi:glycosyltransferase involved in cell wall biosynthesis
MKVSVVIPVHNGEKYLAQAIESVLAQTHRDLELLVINDGSTDGSLDIMERYARADSRIKVIAQVRRGHVAAANRGLEEAHCEWVARLDADDIFHHEKIERQLAFVRSHPDVRIVGTLGHFINHEGRVLGLVGSEGPFTIRECCRLAEANQPVSFIHSSTIVHRESILRLGGYRTKFLQVEDIDLWNRVAEEHPVVKMPEPLVLYRIHPESMTMSRQGEQRIQYKWVIECMMARRARRAEPSFEEFLRIWRNRPWHRKLAEFVEDSGEQLYQRAALSYANGEYLKTISCLCISLVIHPRHVFPRLYMRKIAPALRGAFGGRGRLLRKEIKIEESPRHASGK